MCGDQFSFCLKLHVDALCGMDIRYTRKVHVTPVGDMQVERYAAAGQWGPYGGLTADRQILTIDFRGMQCGQCLYA